MRLLFSLLISMSTVSAFGQFILPILDDSLVPKHEIIISGVGDYSGSSLLNSMSDKLLFGGEISDQIKNASFDKQGVINRFGINLKGEIEYRNTAASLFKKYDLGYGIRAAYYNLGGVLYPKDMFGLAFYGNASYSGQTADFSGTSFSFYSFQKVGFSLIDKKSNGSVTLNFINLSNYSAARVDVGTIYQSMGSDSLNLNLDASFRNATGSSFSKGVGLCLDGDIRLPLKGSNEKTNYLQLLVKNVGFALMNNPARTVVIDTNFNTTGLTFDELINANGLLKPGFNSLDSLQISDPSSSNWVLLPGMIQVTKLVEPYSKRRLQEFYGFRILLTRAYIPMVFVGADARIGKGVHIGVNGSYGGFTDFMLGMYSYGKIGGWTLGIGSENILGFFTNKAYGQAISLRLRCGF
jgi:hypothetical protein